MNSIVIRIVDHSAATTALAICAVAVSPMGIAECRCQRMGITQRRPLIGLSLSRASVAEAKKSAVPEREIGGAGAHSFSPDLKSCVGATSLIKSSKGPICPFQPVSRGATPSAIR
jgi:hypothetical protein